MLNTDEERVRIVQTKRVMLALTEEEAGKLMHILANTVMWCDENWAENVYDCLAAEDIDEADEVAYLDHIHDAMQDEEEVDYAGLGITG